MSWKYINIDLSFLTASFISILSVRIGSNVEPPDSPAKLFSFSILCSTSVRERHCVKILQKIFLNTSNKTMGRVLLISHSHFISFEMGYKSAYFQLVGVLP